MRAQSNWWETFFEGVTVDMWLRAVPPDTPSVRLRASRECSRFHQEPNCSTYLRRGPAGAGAGRARLPADRRRLVDGIPESRSLVRHASPGDVGAA